MQLELFPENQINLEMYENDINELEMALNTARFIIFISGLCGLVLGLTCVYLVV